MLPQCPVSARRKRVGLIFGALVSCGFGTYEVLTGPSPRVGPFVALACVVIGNAAVLFVGWPDTDGFLIRVHGRRIRGERGGRGERGQRGGRGPSGTLGPKGDAGHAPMTAGERPVLRAVARLMPRAAGRRWLAEAESLLFEMPAARRGRAVRSYLCSAPRLAGMMWARRLRRRTGRRA